MQHHVHARLQGLLLVQGVGVGGQGHDGHVAPGRRQLAQRPRQGQAVHVGHHHVHQSQVKVLGLQQRQRLRARAGGAHPGLGPHRMDLHGGEHQIHRVVVDHQHVKHGAIGQVGWRRNGRSLRRGCGPLEPKHRATPRLAVHPDLPALQHHQALAQAQPQAGAAKVFGGLQVGRLKAVEDVGLALQGNAATRVFDLHLQVLVEPSHVYLDLALRGELDGVVDQVAHHLAQPGAIDPHRLWHVVCKVELPCQTLVQGFLPQGCERLAEQGAQFAGARKKHHLPAL